MKILKAAPGLDPDDRLGRLLGPGFEVRAFDPARPLEAQVGEANVLILRDVPVGAAVMAAAPGLRLLQRYGQHLVGVDLAEAARRGIPVARVPPEATGSSLVVAEHALFLIYAVARRYREAAARLARGKLGGPMTLPVAGRRLALVGIGRTGAELARLARGLGMRVSAVRRRPPTREVKEELGLDFLGGSKDLERVLGEADFVSIHLPLEPDTEGFFGTRAFAAMKPGAILVNIARGPIVDRGALVEALESGRLAGAGLDVFWQEPPDPDDPLLRMPNVIATPHHAAASEASQERLAAVVAGNIRKVARGETPDHLVEAGESQAGRSRGR